MQQNQRVTADFHLRLTSLTTGSSSSLLSTSMLHSMYGKDRQWSVLHNSYTPANYNFFFHSIGSVNNGWKTKSSCRKSSVNPLPMLWSTLCCGSQVPDAIVDKWRARLTPYRGNVLLLWQSLSFKSSPLSAVAVWAPVHLTIGCVLATLLAWNINHLALVNIIIRCLALQIFVLWEQHCTYDIGQHFTDGFCVLCSTPLCCKVLLLRTVVCNTATRCV